MLTYLKHVELKKFKLEKSYFQWLESWPVEFFCSFFKEHFQVKKYVNL